MDPELCFVHKKREDGSGGLFRARASLKPPAGSDSLTQGHAGDLHTGGVELGCMLSQNPNPTMLSTPSLLGESRSAS